jgi:Zn-dependent protease with chaperone function
MSTPEFNISCILLLFLSASTLGSETNSSIKEITNVSPLALVVLDRNCPNIVQPYQVTDNVASLLGFGLKNAVTSAAASLGNILSGKKLSLTADEKIPDSMRLAAKQLNWLPMEAEQLYGKRQHETESNILSRDSKLGKKYYPVADTILNELLSKISEQHDYTFQLFILKNSTDNAVARPGGYLYIDQGLIDNELNHPLAHFALAHEVAHVLQRHETQELQSMAVDSFTAKKDLVETLPMIKTQPSALLDHVKIGADIYTKHHVDQELQADSCATRLLSRVYPARSDLTTVINAFVKVLPPPTGAPPAQPATNDAEKLVAATHDIVSTPLDRHPNTQERAANLQTMLHEVSISNQ